MVVKQLKSTGDVRSIVRRATRRLGHPARQFAQSIRSARSAPQAFQPGDFYSPVANVEELLGSERDRIWPVDPPDPVGVRVEPEVQRRVVATLADQPRPDWGPGGPGTYDPANDQFPPQDARTLYAMVRTMRPRRVIEVGCGWSTTVTAQAIRDGQLDVDLTCIEPYPREFLSTISEIATLRRERVENTPLDVLTSLEAGDVLFIDTSHVAKTGSDVVHLVLEVLPRLSAGVVVHIHDIFLPFDYPEGWIQSGFGWNEQYIVQAFLSGNSEVTMLAMNRWLSARLPEELEHAGIPTTGGSSIWFAIGPVPAAFGITP